MAKTKVTKAKGHAPDSYKPNKGYCIGVKGPDKTIGFYSEHTLGDKANLKVNAKNHAHTTTRAEAHTIMAELRFKWPKNVYTMFKFT